MDFNITEQKTFFTETHTKTFEQHNTGLEDLTLIKLLLSKSFGSIVTMPFADRSRNSNFFNDSKEQLFRDFNKLFDIDKVDSSLLLLNSLHPICFILLNETLKWFTFGALVKQFSTIDKNVL